MTPVKLQELARQAGGMPLMDGDYQAESGEWAFTGGELARFAALVRVTVLEEAEQHIETKSAYVYGAIMVEHHEAAEWLRALAQQAGEET